MTIPQGHMKGQEEFKDRCPGPNKHHFPICFMYFEIQQWPNLKGWRAEFGLRAAI